MGILSELRLDTVPMPSKNSSLRVDEMNAFATLLTRYLAALDRLETLGLRIAPNSRLNSYRHRLSSAVVDPLAPLPEALVHELAFDLREIDEIIEITDNLPHPVDDACMRLLRSLQRGADDPDTDSSTNARDDQYELYLGAVLRRARMPTRHGAPDLTTEYQGREYHVEAKRPSKPERLDDRLRSAVHQLRRLPEDGIIALSVDQIVRPPRTLLSAPTFNDLAPRVASLVREFVSNNIRVWRNRLGREPVAAVIITARVPALIAASGHTALGTNIHVEVLRDQSGAARFAVEAAQAYQRAQMHG